MKIEKRRIKQQLKAMNQANLVSNFEATNHLAVDYESISVPDYMAGPSCNNYHINMINQPPHQPSEVSSEEEEEEVETETTMIDPVPQPETTSHRPTTPQLTPEMTMAITNAFIGNNENPTIGPSQAGPSQAPGTPNTYWSPNYSPPSSTNSSVNSPSTWVAPDAVIVDENDIPVTQPQPCIECDLYFNTTTGMWECLNCGAWYNQDPASM